MTAQREAASNSTSASLLDRVRRRDPLAWQRFAALYSPLVYGWARRGGLQESDAADVVQDVFQSIFAKIDNFHKNGDPQQSSFRGWLWAIARNRIRLHYRLQSQQTRPIGGSQAALELQQVPALLESETEPQDPSSHRALLHRALRLIEADFSPATWQAFLRQAIEGQDAADVALDLGTSPSVVRQAKYRVLCRLRDELAGL